MNTFKQTTRKLVLLSCAALFSAMVWAAPPDGVGGGGGNKPPPHDETQGNNLSFPAVLVDGYMFSAATESLTVEYAGDYPGLTVDQIQYLEDNGPWYPQKTEGNSWSADFVPAGGDTVLVSYVDWGDNIESVNPKLRRPFRLEIQLYQQLNAWEDFDPESNGMTRYVMAELEYPSSSSELQGTNGETIENNFATVVSNLWKLRIQYCGAEVPTDLEWNDQTGMWESETASCSDVPVSFAVELNVGGKLIFGGSQGGWKPAHAGFYRITFYGPPESYLSLGEAVVGNYADFSVPPVEEDPPVTVESDEGDEGAAEPDVDQGLNISYVDVEVVGGGGGGGKKPKLPKSVPGKKLGHYK